MKNRHRIRVRRGISLALLCATGVFALPAMALQCLYSPGTGPLNQYQCSTSYTPVPDDILYWADSAGGIQWGGTQFTATCDSGSMLNVSLHRWNGRRFEILSSASGMCLSND